MEKNLNKCNPLSPVRMEEIFTEALSVITGKDSFQFIPMKKYFFFKLFFSESVATEEHRSSVPVNPEANLVSPIPGNVSPLVDLTPAPVELLLTPAPVDLTPAPAAVTKLIMRERVLAGKINLCLEIKVYCSNSAIMNL